MALTLSISFPSFNPYVYVRFSPANIIQTQKSVTHNIEHRLHYKGNTVPTFSKSSASRIPASISGFRCDDLRWFELTFSSFVICAALSAAGSPTFLRNRSTETSSSVDRSPIGSTARAARRWFVLQTFINFQVEYLFLLHRTNISSELSEAHSVSDDNPIMLISFFGSFRIYCLFYAANGSLPSYSGGRRPMMMGIERDLTTTSTRSRPIGKQPVGSSILHAQLSHHTVALELICDIAL